MLKNVFIFSLTKIHLHLTNRCQAKHPIPSCRHLPPISYVPCISFPSAMVPKTTNCTTGMTPYPTFTLQAKRKLDYSSTGKTVHKGSKQKLLSVTEQHNQNKIFITCCQMKMQRSSLLVDIWKALPDIGSWPSVPPLRPFPASRVVMPI